MADISKIELPSGEVYDLKDVVARQGLTILSYGFSTWNDFITAYNSRKIVYCRASSGSNPAVGSQLRLAFMAYVNNAETPTEVEFQYYRSVSSHTESQQGDQVYVYKLNSSTGWSIMTREAYSKIEVGDNLSTSYTTGTKAKIKISHTASGVTEGSKGDTTSQTPEFGETFKVLSGTVDTTGHLTAFDEHSVTIPNSTASSSTAGLMSSTDKSNLDTLVTNVGSHTVAKDVPSNAVFTDTTYTGTSPITVSGTTISHANSGVTAASKGDTANQTPTWGGTFKVPSGTVNATGHLTAFAEHTVTIPSAVATTSANGLMSSSDKTSLNTLTTQMSTAQTNITSLQTSVTALGNLILCGTGKQVTSSKWSSSGEEVYLYKADVAMTGVDSSYFPLVQFNDADINSFEFSPKTTPKTNAVTIYCKTKPNRTITIPNIICFKGKLV